MPLPACVGLPTPAQTNRPQVSTYGPDRHRVSVTRYNYDKAYLATHSVGFDKFKAYVMGEEDGVPKTPAWAAPLCHVPEWTIKALDRNFAKNRTSICHKFDGGGLKRAPHCHEAARLEVYLLAMQGWGRPGVHQLKGINLPGSARPPRFARGAEPFMDGQPAPLTKALNGRVLREWDTNRPFIPGNEIPKAINNPPVSWYGGGVMTRTETQFVKTSRSKAREPRNILC